MAPKIESIKQVERMIYAFTLPGFPALNGYTKIGETKQNVQKRISQNLGTLPIPPQEEWFDYAKYKDGSGYFTDKDFHKYLENHHVERFADKREWFRIEPDAAHLMFWKFSAKKPDEKANREYELRDEQKKAVEAAKEYFTGGGNEFLFNCKPRFGKVLTTYELIIKMGLKKVLIVTNRPSISNSWVDDFFKFIAWQHDYKFVADTDAMKGNASVYTRNEYLQLLDLNNADAEEPGMIAFVSLQDLKGSSYFGGEYPKLKWVSELPFDLLIVDEAQEGVDTFRTDRAFLKINRKYTLYLSGTPFKALSTERYTSQQIYNWTYTDEQEAKSNWNKEEHNPYEDLPNMSMFTYQLSDMIKEKITADMSDEGNGFDVSFDLNEFFRTNDQGRFVYEDDVKKFLNTLTTGTKYPFSTEELRNELKHTIWYLNRVDSCKALYKLLKAHPVFKEYEIVVAAGDGLVDDLDANERYKEDRRSYNRVKKAIEENDKTITLTVGQLTVGITIPEWTGILMLCNCQSASSYIQAIFRTQNPYLYMENGKLYRKETSYVFDFDPARTLIVFEEFANNLNSTTAGGKGTTEQRKENIKKLLNFFPVIGEDSEGEMVELDAQAVLSIPRKLKSQEVVRRGFMSNYLFQNISGIFSAPEIVGKILNQMPAADQGKLQDRSNPVEDAGEIQLDENGEVEISNDIVIGTAQSLFSEKTYENMAAPAMEVFQDMNKTEDKTVEFVKQQMDVIVSSLVKQVEQTALSSVVAENPIKKAAEKQVVKQVTENVRREGDAVVADYTERINSAKADYETAMDNAVTNEEKDAAFKNYNEEAKKAADLLSAAAQELIQHTPQKQSEHVIESVKKKAAEEKKKTIEDDVRAHLRGFARTIPSFIMAYGDRNLRLDNFETYVEHDAFKEVSFISMEQFLFLRDGGDYADGEIGEKKHYDGHLFDETVFSDSVQEFLNKKDALANYFDESSTEDIFDYIPPQKTFLIFTPKWVASMMCDKLESENPGCFDDPDATFADLYMKSGLYITEIVKRLFRSEAIKAVYPDDKERIRHILTKQVYGIAPTRCIYLIATNYILGFDADMKEHTQNFAQADTAQAAKEGKLEEVVRKCFPSL